MLKRQRCDSVCMCVCWRVHAVRATSAQISPKPKLEYRKYAESNMNANKTDLPLQAVKWLTQSREGICSFICYFVTREKPFVCFSCSQLFMQRHLSAKVIT